jgi:hypothetical protein
MIVKVIIINKLLIIINRLLKIIHNEFHNKEYYMDFHLIVVIF